MRFSQYLVIYSLGDVEGHPPYATVRYDSLEEAKHYAIRMEPQPIALYQRIGYTTLKRSVQFHDDMMETGDE